MRTRRDVGRFARVSVGCSLATFVAVQFALNLFIETCHPEEYDPEYRGRLVLLRERVREAPERPLLLVVGSSRILTDFQPEQLPPLGPPGGPEPLSFNLSHSGSGPLLNLVLLQRTLRAGIVPKWVVAEIVPPMLGTSGQSSVSQVAQSTDLRLLARYMNPLKLYGWYLWERVRVGCDHRDAFFRYGMPWEATNETGDGIPLTPLGWVEKVPHADADPAEIRRLTAVVRSQYYPRLQQLHVRDSADRAIRELLELCRQRQIKVVLLLTPESSEFRGWYSPEARRLVDYYCGRVSREYGVPLVDAREWLPDDAYTDGHHVTAVGARAFTERLGNEVLQPLVSGR